MANTYDLTQTGSEVQAILNDANNIKGASAQTTLTTDYILLKDTNGQYHKILKDSFTEACRNVLAGLLVNNDKGTTISQIAAIASGDFGSVTPANLASVLGGFANLVIMTNQDSITWDSLNSTCFVAANGKNAGCPTTATNLAGFCIVSGTTGFQLAIPNSGDTNIYFRHRWGSAWQTWRKIPFTAAS